MTTKNPGWQQKIQDAKQNIKDGNAKKMAKKEIQDDLIDPGQQKKSKMAAKNYKMATKNSEMATKNPRCRKKIQYGFENSKMAIQKFQDGTKKSLR